VDVLDGDSFGSNFMDSYGTRTWFFRQFENEDGPCVAFLDPTKDLQFVGVDPAAGSGRLELLGNYPNPFRGVTNLHFRLPQQSRVSLEVFDVQGRLVTSHAYGVQQAGEGSVRIEPFTSHSGLFLYRLHVTDPVTGAARGTLSGRLMVLR
jgi:hypothetical protein